MIPGLILLLTTTTLHADSLATDLVKQLAASTTNASLTVGVGNFLYQDTQQSSAFSALLNTQVESALARAPKFELVAHDRLVEIQNEVLFRGTMPLDPGQPIGVTKITNPQTLVRGRFFIRDSNIVAEAELIRLDDGTILARATNSLPQATVMAANPPGNWDFSPPNFALSESNIRDVDKRLTAIPHDFDVALLIKQCRRNFAEGEKYALRVHAPQACHIAVFDHQVDGSTVMLFPNAYQTNTWIPGKVDTEIPVPNDRGFYLRVSEPFGADVIQVIACTEDSNLHRNMARIMAAPAKVGATLANVSRDLLAGQIRHLNSPVESAPTNNEKWAETHFVFSSYPAPVQHVIRPAEKLQLDLSPGLK